MGAPRLSRMREQYPIGIHFRNIKQRPPSLFCLPFQYAAALFSPGWRNQSHYLLSEMLDAHGNTNLCELSLLSKRSFHNLECDQLRQFIKAWKAAQQRQAGIGSTGLLLRQRTLGAVLGDDRLLAGANLTSHDGAHLIHTCIYLRPRSVVRSWPAA